MFNASEQSGELTIRLPPFWQMVKAGAAFTLGAALPGIAMVFAIFVFIFLVGGLAMLGSSSRQAVQAPTPAPSVLHHR